VLLALDTATATTTVALADDSDVLAQRSLTDGRRHAEVLAPFICDLLADVGTTARSLTHVVVGVGPGPFTGLRVGLVTAMAMSDGLGIPLSGVVTLDVLAHQALAEHDDGRPLLVATDARRKEVYWATYYGALRTAGPSVGRASDVAAGYPRHRVAGIGGELYRVDFVSHGCEVVGPQHPDAGHMARLALARLSAGVGFEPVQPLYLRRPDAAPPAPRKQVTPR
jgi:tRNA threonylcarbamoyladenosine biosynthesis protein TsaB